MATIDGREDFGENPTYFTGVEVENTPLKGVETLFVVGCQTAKDIDKRAKQHNVNHVYLGCGYCFEPKERDDWLEWNKTILDLLAYGYWVTLDYNVKYAGEVLLTSWNEHNKFVSMISVPLPYINQHNYNATVKIDDKHFKGSNSGVWCHSLHDLRSKETYTDFTEYVGDKVVK